MKALKKFGRTLESAPSLSSISSVNPYKLSNEQIIIANHIQDSFQSFHQQLRKTVLPPQQLSGNNKRGNRLSFYLSKAKSNSTNSNNNSPPIPPKNSNNNPPSMDDDPLFDKYKQDILQTTTKKKEFIQAFLQTRMYRQYWQSHYKERTTTI